MDKLYTQHYQEIKQLYKKLSDTLDSLSGDKSLEEKMIITLLV